jgi:HD-GYP domain-containing protein (c-di-GMP phosphodiesterase class II)
MNIQSPAASPGIAVTTGGKSWLHPLHVHISVLFTALILISGSLMVWHNYRETSNIMLSASDVLFEGITRETALEINRIYGPIQLLTDLYTRLQITTDKTLAERLGRVPAIVEGLTQNPAASAFYVGYENGDFFLVRPLPADAETRKNLNAPTDAVWLVQSIDRDQGAAVRAHFLYLDRALKTVLTVERPDYAFDPRTRGWYKLALASDQQIKTAPYMFFTTREPGVTFARRSSSGTSVVGADVTLTELSAHLRQHKIAPSAEIALFDADGRVLAHTKPGRALWYESGKDKIELARLTDLGSPALEGLMAVYKTGTIGTNFPLDADNREWIGRISRLNTRDTAIHLGMVAPRTELLRDAAHLRTESIKITLGILLLTIPVAWFLSHAISRSLRQLSAEAQAIQEFKFDQSAPINSFVQEIDELARTMEVMRSTIRRFLDLSTALAAEKDLDRLLERVLAESLSFSGADVGTIYLMDDDGMTLQPALRSARDDSLLNARGPLAPLHCANDRGNAIVAAARENKTRTVVLNAEDSDVTTRYFAGSFKAYDTARIGVAAIPLRNRQQEITGVLAVGRVVGADAAGEPFPAELISFIEALSGSAAVSIEARRLLKQQQDLLESMIQLVAGAIDAKSPYTGGHCQRVPTLAKMLVRAACDAQSGPYRDFNLSEEEWEAVHIASWLHDCGKVTTPEYVVDKATKLETIGDRIHEVRMRFEVLKRDAGIDYWQAVAAGGDRAALKHTLDAACAELDAEFAFIAECNIGGEFMAPDKVERLKQIAQRSWLRTLDDRLGVSRDELLRKQRTPAPALPAREPLLADKAEHVFERDAQDRIPAAGNAWGFRLDAPKHKFNKGEIHNLSIGRGTLTDEERFIINDHIVQTIIMLSRLPFPKHLRNVPELAGGHHEKMDGTGYPKRLKRDEMSPVARMLAIADIFEALTAADRPYKKGKTLSESIKIMGFMKKDQHIDAELFELFLTSGVYRSYAEQFMRPEQIDEVDIRPYVAA